jgi:hypothetical protein
MIEFSQLVSRHESDPSQFARLAEKYAMKVVGPPLSKAAAQPPGMARP